MSFTRFRARIIGSFPPFDPITVYDPPPPEKTGGRARHLPPRNPRRASPNRAPSGATAQSVASPFRIRGEKSPNINQKRQQFRRKLKIARKRRTQITMWRAGRNSPLKPPFRPARFLVGFFGDLGNQGEGCPRRKNEGAVADQRLLTALTAFFSSQRQSQDSKRPTSALTTVSGAPLAPTRMVAPHRRALAYGQSATGVAFPYRSSPGAGKSP